MKLIIIVKNKKFINNFKFLYSIKSVIRENKLKRLKLRENLRFLRKLDNYKLTKPNLSLKTIWSNLVKGDDYSLDIYNLSLTMNRALRKTIPIYLISENFVFKDWVYIFSKVFIKRLKLFSSVLVKSNLITLNGLGARDPNLLLGNLLSKFTNLVKPSITLPVSIDRVLILNNKKSQPYITSLSKSELGWAVDTTLSPGIVSSLFFGANDKHARAVFKKKDKNIMKILIKSFKIILVRFINNKSGLMVQVRSKPKSLEVYNLFFKLINLVLNANILIMITQPRVRHTFIKLRRYARVKRRLRKTVTSKVSELRVSNKLRASSCELATMEYANRFLD